MRRIKGVVFFFLILTVITLSIGLNKVKAVEDEENTCTIDSIPPVVTGYHDFVLEQNQLKPSDDYFTEDLIVTEDCGNYAIVVQSGFIKMDKLGTYPLYFYVSDENYNTTTIVVNVEIKYDITDPELFGVVNKELKAHTELSDELFLTGVSATDNREGTITITVDYSQVLVGVVGSYPVTYTATDSSGNSSSQTIQVVIYDDEAPIITLPDNPPTYEVHSDALDWLSLVQVSDNVDSNPVLEISENTVDLNAVGIYHITYTATDEEGNKSTNTLEIQVVDTTSPVITVTDQTFEVFDEMPDWLQFITVTDNYDDELTIEIISNDVNLSVIGSYVVTYKATDDYGNETIVEMDVYVVDTTDPEVTVTNPQLEVYSETPDWKQFITVTDNYDVSPVITIDAANVNLDLLGDYVVTVTVTDQSGNTTITTFTVSVVDETIPTVTLPNEPVTFEVYDEAPVWEDLITVIDNYDTSLEITITENTVNLENVGEYFITYVVKDDSENETTVTLNVLVVDTKKPVITVTPQTFEVYTEVSDWLSYAVVSDNYDDNPQLEIVSNTVNLEVLGDYVVTYKAIDSEGNETTIDMNVSVVDTTNPEVVVDTQKIEVYSATPVWENYVTVTDHYDQNPIIIVDYSSVDLNTLGDYIISVTVTDQSGNTTVTSFTLQVVDETVPTLILPETTPVIEVFSEAPDYNNYITVTDNYDIHPVVTITQEVNLNVLGFYTVNVTVTDSSNNQTTGAFQVQVVDTVKPEFIFDGTFEYKIGDPHPNYLENLSVTDNYDVTIPNEKVKVHDLYVNLNMEGLYPITFEVMDSSGNYQTKTTTIRVFDEIAPVLTGQKDLTLKVDSTNVDYLNGVNATDNILNDITNRIIVDDSHVNYTTPGTYKLNYIVTDLSGNTTVETVNVNVVIDDTAPIIVNTKDFVVEVHGNAPDYLSGVSATDDFDEVEVTVNTDLVLLSSTGEYIISYTATDESGNTSEVEQKVVVVDTTKPVITGTKDLTIEVDSEAPNYLTNVSATDNYDTNLTIDVNDDLVNLEVVDTYEVTYTVTDSSNNTETITINVHVVDTTKPVITGTKDITIEVDSGGPDYLEGVDATDNYDTQLTIDVNDDLVNLEVVDSYEITYTVTDSSNNTKTVTVNVNVVDTTDPTITGHEDVTIKVGDTFDPLAGITVSDNYSQSIETSSSSNYDVTKAGVYKIDITAEDENGNSTTVSYNLTVEAVEAEKNTSYVLLFSIFSVIFIVSGVGILVLVNKKR